MIGRVSLLALTAYLSLVPVALGQSAGPRRGTGGSLRARGTTNDRAQVVVRRQTHLPSSQYPILPEQLIVAQASCGEELAYESPVMTEYGPSTVQCQQCLVETPQPMIWGKAEYLLWWTRGIETPSLATTSPAGTTQTEAGVLGLSSTNTRFGDAGLTNEARSGGRYSIGFWLDSCQCLALETTYTRLGDESESFSASSRDSSILARPFFNTQNNADESHLISFPDVASGALDIDLTTEFQTLEVLFRRKVVCTGTSGVDYLLGYRYAEVNDGLRINESTLLLSPAAQGATIALFDQFETSNEFHGGELGFVTHWQTTPCLSGEFVAKVALGSTNSDVNVSGETTSAVGGASATAPGGLLAQPTNIGSIEKLSFSAIAEFGLNFRRRFNPRMVGTFGYTFMYWSDVARVGDQVDLSINTSQIAPGTLTGEARPQSKLDTTSFWAQGLNVGLEVAF